MLNKKDLNKKDLEKVTGGDYGRQWDLTKVANSTTPTDSTNPIDTQFKPEDVGADSDLLKIK